MVSSISFGKIANIGGKTVLSGSNSGIDTDALITSLTAARRAPAVTLETKQKDLASQSTAYASLKTLLTRFQTSADLLRNAPGISNSDKNVFQYRTTTLTAQGTTVSGDNFVSATVKAGTTPQTHVISNVSQLATATVQQFSPFTMESANEQAVFTLNSTDGAPASDNAIAAGTVTIKGQIITLADGDTLQQVVNKFNAVSNVTGIRASAIKTAPGRMSLIMTGTATGEDAKFDLANSAYMTQSSNTDANPFSSPFGSFTTVEAGGNAKFKLDGIDVEEESNTFSDLIDGTTLTLKQTMGAGVGVNLNIAADVTNIKAGITNLLDDYNSLRTFYATQTARNDDGSPKSTTAADGTKTVTAVLANDNTLRSIMNSLANEVSHIVGGVTSGNYNKLADIGVTFTDYAGDDTNPATKNILTLDDTKLTTALNTNFDQVVNLFQFNSSTTVDKLQVFKRTNDLAISDFTVDLDPVGKTYKATYTLAGATTPTTIDLTATTLSGGSLQLAGPSGSPIAGLQMIYAGNAFATGTVHMSQGLADRMYNALDNATNSTNGTLTNAVTTITDQKSRYTDEITKIDDKVATYRDQLVEKFSKLESALASINTILQTLDAQAQARNSSNS